MKLGHIILAYFLFINLVAFLLMGIDKKKSKKGAFRVSEASLFVFALLGGSIGSCMGMLSFHHKTNHWYFQIGIPLIAFLQTGSILALLVYKLGLLL